MVSREPDGPFWSGTSYGFRLAVAALVTAAAVGALAAVGFALAGVAGVALAVLIAVIVAGIRRLRGRSTPDALDVVLFPEITALEVVLLGLPRLWRWVDQAR